MTSLALVYDLRPDRAPRLELGSDSWVEFDTPATIDALSAAIVAEGYDVRRLEGAAALVRFLAGGGSVDAGMSIAEGRTGRGREAQVAALLDMYDIPYAFSDATTLALAHDKGVAKRLWRDGGLATAPFQVISAWSPDACETCEAAVGYPAFVKPVAEGCSKGIDAGSIVWDRDQLARRVLAVLRLYSQPALVESYLPGPEFTVGIIGSGAEARAIGVLAVTTKNAAAGGVCGYHEKEHCEALVSYRLDRSPRSEGVAALALSAFRALACRDAARVDVRVSADGEPMILELNPLPGLHPTHSDLPILATAVGSSYQSLISAILTSMATRLSSAPRFG